MIPAVSEAMTDQNVMYSCSLLCEPRHAGDAADEPAQPERLIEKWARENSAGAGSSGEALEKKQLEAFTKRMTRQNSFITNPAVLHELGLDG